MPSPRRPAACALPVAILLMLGGCVAAPVAQLAAQHMMQQPAAAQPSAGGAMGQVAQIPDTGSLTRGIGDMLRRAADPSVAK